MRFTEYYELSDKMSWRPTQLDWQELRRESDAGLVGDFDRRALLGTAVIEQGVPHYGMLWSRVQDLPKHWDLWQFTSLWTGEEQRHSYALERACQVLGIDETVATDMEKVRTFEFADTHAASCSTGCYQSVAGMLTYTVIQELATHRFYALAAKEAKSPFLRKLFKLIAGDEMRHHVFYRDSLKELHGAAPHPEQYSQLVYEAVKSFRMPHLLYDLQVPFFERGGWDIGLVARMQFKAQLIRCFSFDARLLARLIKDTSAELDNKRTAFVRPATA